jgi:hypothetical protein
MKKLFSLMLVLAFCGLASAEVNFWVSDTTGATTITATAGSVITLEAWYNDIYDPMVPSSDVGSVDLGLGKSGGGTILGSTVTAGNRTYGYSTALKDGSFFAEYMIGNANNGALTAGLNPALVTITFQCGSTPGTEGLWVSDMASYAPGASGDDTLMTDSWSMTINVAPVPEPATIALLAIGGLLLRKKK